jgi:DNA repair exonuclease SbcCD ATPase subunit
MKFLSIALRGIRNFDERTIQFQGGLNIVCGPNESGKSTILDSLLFAVTGDRSEMPKLIQWKTEYSRIDVQYETDAGQRFTMSRVLHPEEKSRLENSTIVEDFETIQTTLEDHFGSISRVILENSTVVKHNEMEIMREVDTRDMMKKQMETVLTGDAKRSTEEVMQILDTNIFQAQRSLVDVRNQVNQILQRLEPYRGIEEEYQKLEEKKAVYEEDLKKYEKILEIYKSRLWYGELVEEIKKYERILDRLEDIESYISAIPFEEVRKATELQKELVDAEEKKNQISHLIEEREKELQSLYEERERGSSSFLGKIFGFISKKSKDDLPKRISILEDLLAGDRTRLHDQETTCQDIESEIRGYESQIGSYRSRSLEELTQMKKKYEWEIENLLQGQTKVGLEDSKVQKKKERDELRSAIFKAHPEILDQPDERILREKEDYEKRIELLTEEIRITKEQLEVISSRKEEKDRIQEELKSLESRKEELETEETVDTEALTTIRSVYTDLKEQFIPKLEEKSGEILQRITEGKYKSVSIRKEDLEIFVAVPGRTLDSNFLSQGTRDQLHLSLRIALSELLSGGRNLPLLFDESFYTSDAGRLKETFAMLQEIAQNTQVILFTHNERFLYYGNPIVLTTHSENNKYHLLH